MAHDHPLVKAPAPGEEAVTAVKILGVLLCDGDIRPHTRVGKDKALRLYGVGKRGEKAPFLGKTA